MARQQRIVPRPTIGTTMACSRAPSCSVGPSRSTVRTAPRSAPVPRTTSIRTERDEVLFARRDRNHDNVISPYEYGVGR